MNVVFVYSLLKKKQEQEEAAAQVRITENNGAWEIIWEETDSGGEIKTDHWFNGFGTDQVMLTFKQRITEKLSEGFLPVLEGIEEAFQLGEPRSVRTAMLEYYSEQHERQEAYQKLRKWRTTTSAKEGIASFMICSNRVLRMICAFLPQTEEELLQIPGMGPRKVELYGQNIVAELKSYDRQTSFPLHWVEEEIDLNEFKQWLFRQRDEKLKKEIGAKQIKQQLLQGIANGLSIEELKQDSRMTRREVIQWIEELDKEGYDVQIPVIKELEAVNEQEKSKAWDGFARQGTRYLKPVLEQLYDVSKLNGTELSAAYEWLRLLRIQYKREQDTALLQTHAG